MASTFAHSGIRVYERYYGQAHEPSKVPLLMGEFGPNLYIVPWAHVS